jgi:CheY-like chemotaxis protein
LIELHDGTIEARSDGLGCGTTFSVRLPMVAALHEAPVREAPAPAAEPRRVLVADDLADAAEMLRLMLDSRGHEVRVANDGAQAIAIAKEFRPDIALLDIGMPRVDGYEAAREIRRALGTGIVLVALTGWGQEEHRQRAREAGFDHHLTKPAEPEELEALIKSAARRR